MPRTEHFADPSPSMTLLFATWVILGKIFLFPVIFVFVPVSKIIFIKDRTFDFGKYLTTFIIISLIRLTSFAELSLSVWCTSEHVELLWLVERLMLLYLGRLFFVILVELLKLFLTRVIFLTYLHDVARTLVSVLLNTNLKKW